MLRGAFSPDLSLDRGLDLTVWMGGRSPTTERLEAAVCGRKYGE